MKRVITLAVNTALVILCCFLASGVIADVTAAVLAPASAAVAAPTGGATEPAARNRIDRQIILARNLFNVSTLNPEPVAAEDESYQKTKLPLRLLGTAAAEDTALSWAAVEDLETKQHLVVRIDQEIKGGARVVRIERRRIVLQNGAQLEELALEGETTPAEPAVARAANRRPPPQRPNARGNLERLADNRFAVNRGELQNLATNPSALFSQARILPKYEGGQMIGVQVSGIKPGSWFEQAGIRDGETITAVNGAAIGADGAPTLFREITQGSATRVTVRGTDGNERELNVDIRD
jgi:general secretion pathway protein C